VLSVAAISAGGSDYYISMSAEKYYDEGVISDSEWVGSGSALLGLVGKVEPSDFRAVISGEGFHGERLVQATARRQPGWDLTFSAPKSVSIVWALGDDETRAAILDCHTRAVSRAVEHVEDNYLLTRRGREGASKEECHLVGTVFHHGTSRNHDPQIHTHVVIHNVCVRHDGTTGTIVSKPLYKAKMEVGSLYRQELRSELERKGFRTQASGFAFEIDGVRPELISQFSSRRKEIVNAIQGQRATAKISERAALATRSRKVRSDLDALRDHWRGKANGWVPVSVVFQPVSNASVGPDIGQAVRALSRKFGPDILDPVRKLTAKYGPDILDPFQRELTRFSPDIGAPLRGHGPNIGQVVDVAIRCAVVRMERARQRLLRREQAGQRREIVQTSEHDLRLQPPVVDRERDVLDLWDGDFR
jgi:conjugative relaxase-like TrwC/TraI family protein